MKIEVRTSSSGNLVELIVSTGECEIRTDVTNHKGLVKQEIIEDIKFVYEYFLEHNEYKNR